MELGSDISNKITSQFTNRRSKVGKNFGDNNITENIDDCSNDIINSTPIQEFYKNQSIFVTGGTGFLGKILIEKLLRSCPDLSKIFVLIRPKKGKTTHERMQHLLKDSVFDNNRSNIINFARKLHGIAGDCKQRNLGISDSDVVLLKEEVSIVFHVAATVRFNEKLNEAFTVNIQSTSSIIDLCKEMRNLKSFVHVSTIYSNCFAANIKEKFYNYSINHKELEVLIKTLPEEFIDAVTPQLTKSWPNTYTFTKALAEDLIRKTCSHLPVGIFRPGVVTSSAYEPTPGWIDNYNNLAGVIASVASGFIRIWYCEPKTLLPFVPVDLTVNAIIASAWATAIQTDRRGENMLIYNFTSTNDAPIALHNVRKNIVKCVNEYPPMNTLWCATFRLTKYHFLYNFYILFLHIIPAYLIDFFIRIVGQKPRILKTYKKIHAVAGVLSFFCTNFRQFEDNNMQDLWNQLDARDQKIFQFSMLNFDWDSYFPNCVKGVRVFLLKDDLKTLKKSRTKYKRLLWIHRFMATLIAAFICWILCRIILILF